MPKIISIEDLKNIRSTSEVAQNNIIDDAILESESEVKRGAKAISLESAKEKLDKEYLR